MIVIPCLLLAAAAKLGSDQLKRDKKRKDLHRRVDQTCAEADAWIAHFDKKAKG